MAATPGRLPALISPCSAAGTGRRKGSVGFVEASARAVPRTRAEWTEIAAFACSTVRPRRSADVRPGMFQTPTAAMTRGGHSSATAEPRHITRSARRRPGDTALLNERGYEPFEFTSILFRPIGREIHLGQPLNPGSGPDRPGPTNAMCGPMSARGWSETPD